jgi:hypothetical protein
MLTLLQAHILKPHPADPSMTRIFLFILLSAFAVASVHADYDPRDDPNSPQSHAAAAKARKASEKTRAERVVVQAATDKKTADAYRGIVKDSAKGLSDQEVIATYPKWQNTEVERSRGEGRKAVADVVAKMNPAQRAMMEKQMGMSMEEYMKKLEPKTAQRK